MFRTPRSATTSPPANFTSGYRDHVWAREKRYVLFSRSDGSEPRLYDAQSDPYQERDLAEGDLDTVGRMLEDYVLKDAGGSLPSL